LAARVAVSRPVGDPWAVSAARWPLTARWENRDACPWAGPVAAVGLVGAAAMAVFGLPPVDVHGALHYAGVMDPMCGMTRGVHQLTTRHFGAAVRFNPGAPVIAAIGAAALLRSAIGATTGRWLNVRVTHATWAWVLAIAVLVPWEVNQQEHATLLRTPFTATASAGIALNAAPQIAAVLFLLLRRRPLRQPVESAPDPASLVGGRDVAVHAQPDHILDEDRGNIRRCRRAARPGGLS
jgi:hypothetical protein